MDSLIEYHLSSEAFSDNKEYFFTMLADRFEQAVTIWADELKNRFNKEFEPIWVLSAKQNGFFIKRNYLILNQKLKECHIHSRQNGTVYLQDYEDLNKEFSNSGFVKQLFEKLVQKQGRVFFLGFTSSSLVFDDPRLIVLGPEPKISTTLDSKIEHRALFERLGVPRNRTQVYYSITEIKANKSYPFFISAKFTSGGHESRFIYTEQDLDLFSVHLREINRSGPFLVADLIDDIALSPNVNAMISGAHQTSVVCITDQLLRGHEYLGNVYPSRAAPRMVTSIIKTTKLIGNHLSTLGFRGLFGLDFIIDKKDNLFTVDLNPRRQGGYLCNVLMSSKLNIIRQELDVALGDTVPPINYNEVQVDYVWAHSKIKPYFPNMRIKKDFCFGTPDKPFRNIGSTYKCIFYPKGALLLRGSGGYVIMSGTDYDSVRFAVTQESELHISHDFEMSEGI